MKKDENIDKKISSRNENAKTKDLEKITIDSTGENLTTNQGLKMAEDEFSLTNGDRGPTLMEDFHFREKMTHFDHERIPERIVHARGTGAHGVFKLYESMEEFTKAKLFTDTNKETPVFTRFSTVAGSRGSADNVRDVRGFAVKFYTEEGNYDLVGNNIPVFFIQDAIKFPDFIHAVKPEPDTEVPQAASAHDTFWDFLANNQETAHMMMWVMSDRAIPRSLRMMEGFAIHTFRWINKEGVSHFVKYHWKPLLGVHSKVWDEAQKTNGKDPDFHRKDLIESIDKGQYPEWELGVQILPEDKEFSLDFDILDPTKIWPEEDIPVRKIGKLTLNRNVDNFFAETEQVAFHPGHLIPGIDFTNDPLLQGRLFSYTDTQLIRLGGPNFHQIPINRPIVPIHNNQRDGYHQMEIHKGVTSYHKNSLNSNSPSTLPEEEGGFSHYEEKVEGVKIRNRSESFKDFYSQGAMFYNSLSQPEKDHLKDAFVFELQLVKSMSVRQQVTEMIAQIDLELSKMIAEEIGTIAPSKGGSNYKKISPALSQENSIHKAEGLKIALWVTKDTDMENLTEVIKTIEENKANYELVSDRLGYLPQDNDKTHEIKFSHLTAASCLFDGGAILGKTSEDPKYKKNRDEFFVDTFNHFKPIYTMEKDLLPDSIDKEGKGISATDNSFDEFMKDMDKHRIWDRKL